MGPAWLTTTERHSQMKRFTFEVVLEEGNDEFWEDIGAKTGIDEVSHLMTEAISQVFPEAEVRLVEYTDK